jgi:hypothetical protein
MSATTLPRAGGTSGTDIARLDGEMVELAMLLPSWQAAALEMAAEDQGLTAGQVVRQLIRDFCDTLNAFGHLNPPRNCRGRGAGA